MYLTDVAVLYDQQRFRAPIQRKNQVVNNIRIKIIVLVIPQVIDTLAVK
jgi:hypothetical protein